MVGELGEPVLHAHGDHPWGPQVGVVLESVEGGVEEVFVVDVLDEQF